MGLLKKNICPHCGAEYSSMKGSCPKCGARKQSSSDRAACSTDSMSAGTTAGREAAADGRWQMIFGLCIIAAVIAAVIILITTTLGSGYDETKVSTPPSESVPVTDEVVTPTPTPTPTVETLTVTFLGQESKGFTMSVGQTVPLGTTHLPLEVEGIVEWTSSNPEIASVDDTGLVTGVAAGSITITATLYNLSVQLPVIVTG